jgi:O-antigen/teichoic acid export membrane protein
MPADDARTLRGLLSRRLVRAGLMTYAFSAVTLVANLVTGIITARALGPGGRGVAVALVTVTQLAGFLFAMGVAQSLSYFVARRREDGPRLLTTWVLMLLPLTAVAIALSELLLTSILAGEGEQAIAVGRWFLFTIVLVIGLELNYGLLLGEQDFVVYNALRLAPPALTALAFVVLWSLDAMTVESALIAATVATGVVLAVGLARSVSQIGVGRPDLRLGLRTLWYGVRGQGVTLAANVNARLDLAMLPAFVTAASLGLYSVATSVALIVYQLSSTFAQLLLPAAAGDPDRGPHKVIGSLHATLLTAGALALGLGLLAEPLISLVYGGEFRDAAEPLRLILPGAVLFAGSTMVSAGLYAAGRPFTATLAQLLGTVVTVTGLVAFLDSGGITAAALVSTAAYTTVFVATAVAYKRVVGIPWRSFVPAPSRVRALSR